MSEDFRIERISIMTMDVPVDKAHMINSIAPVDMPLIVRFGGQEVLLQVGERAYLEAGTLLCGPSPEPPTQA